MGDESLGTRLGGGCKDGAGKGRVLQVCGYLRAACECGVCNVRGSRKRDAGKKKAMVNESGLLLLQMMMQLKVLEMQEGGKGCTPGDIGT